MDGLTSLALKYSNIVDYIELRHEKVSRLYIKKKITKGENFSLNDVHTDSACGCFFRVISYGFEIFDSLKEDEYNNKNYIDLLDSRIFNLIKLAKINGNKTGINFNVFSNEVDNVRYPKKNIFDVNSVILLINNFLERLRRIYPFITVEFSFIKKTISTIFTNSLGSHITQEWDELYAGVTCIFNISGQPFSIPVYDGSLGDYTFLNTLFSDTTIDDINQKVSLYTTLKLNSSYSGTMLILSPAVSALFLHEVIGHFLEADNQIYHDVSLPLGKNISSSKLTVLDSGSHNFSRGYRVYDSEGILCKDTVLIQNGTLTNRLHSVRTSSLFDESATGNGIAISYKHPPICRQRTISIQQGMENYEINSALYLDTPYGGKLDMKNGHFYIESLDAFLLKNGQPTALIKNFSYSGNIYKTLQNIVHVGRTIDLREYSIGCGKNGQRYLRVSSFAPEIAISI